MRSGGGGGGGADTPSHTILSARSFQTNRSPLTPTFPNENGFGGHGGGPGGPGGVVYPFVEGAAAFPDVYPPSSSSSLRAQREFPGERIGERGDPYVMAVMNKRG